MSLKTFVVEYTQIHNKMCRTSQKVAIRTFIVKKAEICKHEPSLFPRLYGHSLLNMFYTKLIIWFTTMSQDSNHVQKQLTYSTTGFIREKPVLLNV